MFLIYVPLSASELSKVLMYMCNYQEMTCAL